MLSALVEAAASANQSAPPELRPVRTKDRPSEKNEALVPDNKIAPAQPREQTTSPMPGSSATPATLSSPQLIGVLNLPVEDVSQTEESLGEAGPSIDRPFDQGLPTISRPNAPNDATRTSVPVAFTLHLTAKSPGNLMGPSPTLPLSATPQLMDAKNLPIEDGSQRAESPGEPGPSADRSFNPEQGFPTLAGTNPQDDVPSTSVPVAFAPHLAAQSSENLMGPSPTLPLPATPQLMGAKSLPVEQGSQREESLGEPAPSVDRSFDQAESLLTVAGTNPQNDATRTSAPVAFTPHLPAKSPGNLFVPEASANQNFRPVSLATGTRVTDTLPGLGSMPSVSGVNLEPASAAPAVQPLSALWEPSDGAAQQAESAKKPAGLPPAPLNTSSIATRLNSPGQALDSVFPRGDTSTVLRPPSGQSPVFSPAGGRDSETVETSTAAPSSRDAIAEAGVPTSAEDGPAPSLRGPASSLGQLKPQPSAQERQATEDKEPPKDQTGPRADKDAPAARDAKQSATMGQRVESTPQAVEAPGPRPIPSEPAIAAPILPKEINQEPAIDSTARPAIARQISLKLTGADATNVDVQVRERAGRSRRANGRFRTQQVAAIGPGRSGEPARKPRVQNGSLDTCGLPPTDVRAKQLRVQRQPASIRPFRLGKRKAATPGAGRFESTQAASRASSVRPNSGRRRREERNNSMIPSLMNGTSGTEQSSATQPATASASATQNSLVSEQTFLQLLVAQLKNQDPENPQDGTQFVAELAQFSSVEQQVQMRTDLDSINSILTTQASQQNTPTSQNSTSTPQP